MSHNQCSFEISMPTLMTTNAIISLPLCGVDYLKAYVSCYRMVTHWLGYIYHEAIYGQANDIETLCFN